MVGGFGGVHVSGGGGRAAGAWGVITVAASDASNAARQPDYRCDGTADDVEIQAAIDLAAVTGGIVQLSDGTYTLAAEITMKSNVELCGVGASTILKMTGTLDDTSGIVEAASAATQIDICDLTIDGNGANLAGGASGHGIYLVDTTFASIRRVNFINIGQSKSYLRACIRLNSGCSDTFIDEPRGISVQSAPTLWYGLYDGGATRTVLQNPYFYGFGDEPVVFSLAQDFLWRGGRACYGANNTVGNGSHGCHITATSGTCRGMIIGVESDHNYDDGFRIDVGGGGSTDVTIFGCNVHHNGNIGISCAASARLMFNRCYENAGGSTNAGIVVSGPNCMVMGNYCYNNGTSGIYALAGVTDCMVEGNVCTNVASSAQNYGIVVALGAANEVTMMGNNFGGNATAPIQLDGAAISIFDWTGSALNVSGLPTSDPGVAGRPWLNSNVMTVSAG